MYALKTININYFISTRFPKQSNTGESLFLVLYGLSKQILYLD